MRAILKMTWPSARTSLTLLEEACKRAIPTCLGRLRQVRRRAASRTAGNPVCVAFPTAPYTEFLMARTKHVHHWSVAVDLHKDTLVACIYCAGCA
jgi:hypothetical protein